MGHGGSREIHEEEKIDRVLDPELSDRLMTALDRLDVLDAAFKVNRDDMRFAQRAKMWGAVSKQVDRNLRTIGNLIHDRHQISLDIGSDGGGATIKPWMEDTERKFQKIYFRLDAGDIIATTGDRRVGSVPLAELSYEWCERMVLSWLIYVVENKR